MAQPPYQGLPQRRPATIADLDGVPSNYDAHILDGRLYAFPRPRFRHSRAQSQLVMRLSPFDSGLNGAGGLGGWLILSEPELHLGGDALVPDLAGWRREGLDIAMLDPYPTVAPAWICEVLSPSTETFDRGLKADGYAKHGVEWMWLIDPEEQTLEVFRRDGGWRPAGRWQGAASVAAPPFEALAWPLGSLWG